MSSPRRSVRTATVSRAQPLLSQPKQLRAFSSIARMNKILDLHTLCLSQFGLLVFTHMLFGRSVHGTDPQGADFSLVGGK
jgi:hypothetical protein